MEETSHFKIYFSCLSLVSISLLFSFFCVFMVWEITNYFPRSTDFFILFVLMLSMALFILMIKGIKYLYYLVILRFTAFVFIIFVFFMGCGGVWFYLFDKYLALFINAILISLFFGVMLIKISRIKRSYQRDFDNYINKVDFGNLTINKENIILKHITNLITKDESENKSSHLTSVFWSIASVGPFLVMGIAFSLEKIGLKIYALIFLNFIFYFVAILIAFSNTFPSYFAYNLFLINHSKKDKKKICFK